MFFDELYQQSVAENENKLLFWEHYLNDLKSIDFDVYSDKLKTPILVPVGNKILFRGELQHTNEVTVSLGADYFVKCSMKQAEVLRQRRIKDAETKVDLYKKEKEYLKNRISFTKENVFAKNGQEILEEYSEAEDKVWREKHRDNVKKYKQSKARESEAKDALSDTELWERLEELNLQEELENELLDNFNEIADKRKENTFLQEEEALLRNSFQKENNNQNVNKSNKQHQQENVKVTKELESNAKKEVQEAVGNEISEHELLLKVLDRQNDLENKLYELKHRERKQSKTELDLIAQLDETEQIDELEDEMDRLYNILETENVDTDDDSNISESNKLKKSITFADEYNVGTSEIEFSHTVTKPNKESYDPKKGITKPSDVYEMYSYLFDNKTTSILKKSKYETEPDVKQFVNKPRKVMFEESIETPENTNSKEVPTQKTIVVKDIVEKVGVNQHLIEGGARPTSLFKKKRMLKK